MGSKPATCLRTVICFTFPNLESWGPPGWKGSKFRYLLPLYWCCYIEFAEHFRFQGSLLLIRAVYRLHGKLQSRSRRPLSNSFSEPIHAVLIVVCFQVKEPWDFFRSRWKTLCFKWKIDGKGRPLICQAHFQEYFESHNSLFPLSIDEEIFKLSAHGQTVPSSDINLSKNI